MLGRADHRALEQRLEVLEVLEHGGTTLSRGQVERVRGLEHSLAQIQGTGEARSRERDEVFGRIGVTEANLAELAAELDAREQRLAELESAQRTLLEEVVAGRLAQMQESWEDLEAALAATREQLANDIAKERAELAELEAQLATDAEPSPQELWREFMGPVVQLAGTISVGSGTLLASTPIAGEPRAWRTYVMTAWHVVRDMQVDAVEPVTPVPVRIYLEGGHTRDETARVVVRNEALDFALLELDTTEPVPHGALLPSAEQLANVTTFHAIVAVGCPLGTDPIPTRGEIASRDHRVEGQRYWMINAPTYIGNSGGAVFDAQGGELLGVFSKIYNHGSIRPTIVPHMGLVTPMDDIREWLATQGFAVDAHGLLARHTVVEEEQELAAQSGALDASQYSGVATFADDEQR
jgi:S1-C subfamily serine protease